MNLLSDFARLLLFHIYYPVFLVSTW